jgi:molybdopterin-guanine dinucleotide biosynthesis protein A
VTPRAAAILAGGRATRMGGGAKPLLAVGGRTILERQLAALAGLVDEVLLVASAPWPEAYRRSGVRLVEDLHPGGGPLAGIEAALAATRADAVLVVGGDMPCLHPAALALVLAARPDADAAAPRVGGYLEPLHARYARRLRAQVSARLARGERSVAALLGAVDVAVVEEDALRAADPSLLTVANVNTPGDLARLAARLR